MSVDNRIAIHEAGHAVAAILLGRRFRGLTIVPNPRWNAAGVIVVVDPSVYATRGRIRRKVRYKNARVAISISVAGDAAEFVAQPTDAARKEFLRSTRLDTCDWRGAFAIAKASDKPIEDIENTLFVGMVMMLDLHWDAVVGLADQLARHPKGSLGYNRAKAIVRRFAAKMN
jgi:Peptidase M50B-like